MSETAPDQPESDWYRESFDGLYPILYAHRDHREAEGLLSVLSAEVPFHEGRVLDLGCGPGRFLAALAVRGAQAVGVDLSLQLLARARDASPRSPLVRADMRSLPLRAESFRTALMMFTTFGYFANEREDAGVLEGIARVLEPGGTLVLDTIHPQHAREHLVSQSDRRVQGLQVLERRWIDPEGPFLRKETRVGPMQDGTTRTYQERLRLYEPARLGAMVEAVGFGVRVRWGDYEGRPFDTGSSPRLLLIAQRGGGPR